MSAPIKEFLGKFFLLCKEYQAEIHPFKLQKFYRLCSQIRLIIFNRVEANCLDVMVDWIPDEAIRRMIFVDTPARLYDFQS